MPEVTNSRFIVRCFEDEAKIGELFLSEDGLHFQKLLSLSQPQKNINGFYTGNWEAPDFIVSANRVEIGERIAPSWSGESIVGLQGSVYPASALRRVKVLSLLFFRRLRIFDDSGLVISRWYLVPWREWVVPADPLMPWGRDFYKYLQFRIGK